MSISYVRSDTSSISTRAFDCTGADILFVSVSNYNETGNASVTYGGVAMTFIASENNTVNSYASLFYLIAPATGSNNIVITNGGSSIAICYLGAKQSAQPDNFTSSKGSQGGTVGLTITPVADNCWVLFTGYQATATTYTGATERQHTGISYFLADSNGVVTGGSPYTQSVATLGTVKNCMIQCSFAPAVAVASPKGGILRFF
jgi:hypothetical protein